MRVYRTFPCGRVLISIFNIHSLVIFQFDINAIAKSLQEERYKTQVINLFSYIFIFFHILAMLIFLAYF